MTENGRHLPAGAGRLAAAHRRGLLAPSPKLVTGVVLLAAGALLHWFGAQAIAFVQLMFDQALAGIAHSEDPGVIPVDGIHAAIRGLIGFSLVILVTALCATVIPALISRRKGGHTAVPLPPNVKRPASLRVLEPAAAFVFILIAVRGVASVRDDLIRGMLGDPAAAPVLGVALVQILWAGGSVLIVTGLIETALLRLQTLEALMLNRSEARREERAGRGSPLAKKWMGRSRSD